MNEDTNLNNVQKTAVTNSLDFMSQYGIEYEIVEKENIDKNGELKKTKVIKLTHTPENMHLAFQFFSNPDHSPDFPGKAALMEQYKKELEAIGGASCTNCAKGKLIRKFMPSVMAAINLMNKKKAQ